MARVSDLHEKWMRDPEYRAAYEELEPEFEDLRRRLRLARAVEEARAGAGLTQAELAARIGTTPETVARFERGRSRPSTRTLEKVARATGTRLRIAFEPA